MSKKVEKKEFYECPVRKTCPYDYNACLDPTKFCRIIGDTPDHFSIGTQFEKYVQDEVKRRKKLDSVGSH
jgi:hypothetical protein